MILRLGGSATIRDSGALTLNQSNITTYLTIQAGGATVLGATGTTLAGTNITVSTSTGAILPPARIPDSIRIWNGGLQTLSIYPPVGGTIVPLQAQPGTPLDQAARALVADDLHGKRAHAAAGAARYRPGRR